MRAYYNMTTSEFVAQHRDIAIKAGARAQVIDQIDAIEDGPAKDEIDQWVHEAAEEGRDKGRKDQWGICFNMLDDKLSKKYVDGITDEQREDILNLMCSIKPE